MTPRETDPLHVEDETAVGRVAPGSAPAVSSRLIGLLLAALSGALVGGLLMFAVGRASAAPRSAPSDSGPWTLLEAPLDPDVAQLAERRVPDLRYAEVPGSSPVVGANGGASPSPAVGSHPILDVPIESMPAITTAAIGGQATWYCGGGSPCTRGYGPSDLVAAIDPTLGIAKGERVTVHYRGRSVEVVIVDVCACGGSRIIDLSRVAFAALADPSLGVIPVSIEFGGPSLTLPPTDVP